MKKGIMVNMTIFLCYLIAVFALNACSRVGGDVHVGFHKNNPPPKAKKVGKPAPPAHAKAYGRRARYAYHYYPDAQVYFDIHRKVYFYFEGRAWKMSVTLPKRIKLARHVTIEMDTDRPYKDFKKHKAKYPPGHAKKKKWS